MGYHMAIKRFKRIKNYLGKKANLISLILFIVIAGLIDNIFLRIFGVFLISLIYEVSYDILFNKKEFLKVINIMKKENDKKQKQAFAIIYLFIPLFETIIVIGIDFLLSKRF
jgi:hypothetical protein